MSILLSKDEYFFIDTSVIYIYSRSLHKMYLLLGIFIRKFKSTDLQAGNIVHSTLIPLLYSLFSKIH